MKFQNENSFEIRKKIQDSQVAILPVGAVEAHGPHLPLGTDNFLAERLSEKLASGVNGFVLPTLPYGQVWSLENFPGSIGISNNTLINILYEVGESLHKQGFRILAIVNGHLGNATAVKEAARKLYQQYPRFKVFYFFYPGTSEITEAVRETPKAHSVYFHACEIETSLMLYLAQEHVEMSKALNEKPIIPATAEVTPTRWETFTETGVLGDATAATMEKGEKIINAALEHMIQCIEHARD